MQISINIQLDPAELADLVRSLVGIVPIVPIPTEPPTTPQSVLPSPDTPAPTSTPVLATILPATEVGKAEAAPAVRKPKPMPEKRLAVLPGEIEKPKRAYSGSRLKLDEFDTLVRSEMKRLSMDKRIPSHGLWNAERDPRLPTLTGVCQRYGVPNLVALAAKLDMSPPLSAINGVGYRTAV